MSVILIMRQVKLIQIDRATPQKIQKILFRILALKGTRTTSREYILYSFGIRTVTQSSTGSENVLIVGHGYYNTNGLNILRDAVDRLQGMEIV